MSSKYFIENKYLIGDKSIWLTDRLTGKETIEDNGVNEFDEIGSLLLKLLKCEEEM